MPIIIPGSGGEFIPYTMVFTVTIPNFPEWAIPMTKVIPYIYFDDAQDASSIPLEVSFNHFWSVSPNQNSVGNSLNPTVTLTVSMSVLPEGGAPYDFPVYVDVDLVFMNERTYSEINNNKS